jgi:PAS domain S-box-containing protein
VELFGRASWLMFAAGAVPTGIAGWWIGAHAGRASPWMLVLIAMAAGVTSAGAALLAWRWFAGPLAELERGLDRWGHGDLSTPLDRTRMAGWRSLSRQFDRAQEDLRRSLEDAQADLARERARLRTLIERIPDAMIITNLRGDLVYFNAPAMPILGATATDAIPGGRALFAPVDPGRWRMRVQELLTAHSAGGGVEGVAADGSPASYRTMVTMFNDAGAGDFGVLIMLRDVTSERRLEKIKEEFFQAAAHDLRAPLFAIQGYLRLLRKSLVPDPRQAGWLEHIDLACEKLTLFVKDALDAARIENGRLHLSPTPVDPAALIRRVLRLFQPLADERGVALGFEIAPDAPAAVEADERLLERLLHNLTANALKFTPRGGRVTVQAAAHGGQLELAVQDDGPGIPEAQRAAVFEKFRQLDSPGLKSGFGLGLSICAKIVKLHRGVIWVEPAPGRGARFVARLPLTQRAKDREET